jgi:hypothetical protein
MYICVCVCMYVLALQVQKIVTSRPPSFTSVIALCIERLLYGSRKSLCALCAGCSEQQPDLIWRNGKDERMLSEGCKGLRFVSSCKENSGSLHFKYCACVRSWCNNEDGNTADVGICPSCRRQACSCADLT